MKLIIRRLKTQFILLAMVSILAACGQRGPLYLPQPESAPAKSDQTEDSETKTGETEDESEKTPGA